MTQITISMSGWCQVFGIPRYQPETGNQKPGTIPGLEQRDDRRGTLYGKTAAIPDALLSLRPKGRPASWRLQPGATSSP
jgi:hypothetical protein